MYHEWDQEIQNKSHIFHRCMKSKYFLRHLCKEVSVEDVKSLVEDRQRQIEREAEIGRARKAAKQAAQRRQAQIMAQELAGQRQQMVADGDRAVHDEATVYQPAEEKTAHHGVMNDQAPKENPAEEDVLFRQSADNQSFHNDPAPEEPAPHDSAKSIHEPGNMAREDDQQDLPEAAAKEDISWHQQDVDNQLYIEIQTRSASHVVPEDEVIDSVEQDGASESGSDDLRFSSDSGSSSGSGSDSDDSSSSGNSYFSKDSTASGSDSTSEGTQDDDDEGETSSSLSSGDAMSEGDEEVEQDTHNNGSHTIEDTPAGSAAEARDQDEAAVAEPNEAHENAHGETGPSVDQDLVVPANEDVDKPDQQKELASVTELHNEATVNDAEQEHGNDHGQISCRTSSSDEDETFLTTVESFDNNGDTAQQVQQAEDHDLGIDFQLDLGNDDLDAGLHLSGDVMQADSPTAMAAARRTDMASRILEGDAQGNADMLFVEETAPLLAAAAPPLIEQAAASLNEMTAEPAPAASTEVTTDVAEPPPTTPNNPTYRRAKSEQPSVPSRPFDTTPWNLTTGPANRRLFPHLTTMEPASRRLFPEPTGDTPIASPSGSSNNICIPYAIQGVAPNGETYIKSIGETFVNLNTRIGRRIRQETWPTPTQCPRRVVFRRALRNTRAPNYRHGMAAQAGGDPVPVPCRLCRDGGNSFAECIVNSAWKPGESCVNCAADGRGPSCSFATEHAARLRRLQDMEAEERVHQREEREIEELASAPLQRVRELDPDMTVEDLDEISESARRVHRTAHLISTKRKQIDRLSPRKKPRTE